MMKKKNVVFNLIVFGLSTFYFNILIAQQSKVDTVIMYLNKSYLTNKVDSVSLKKVNSLISSVSLNDKQIAQIENTLSGFKNWGNKLDFHFVKGVILLSLNNSEFNKAINYGKQQIDQLDKINSPEASRIKSRYLNLLRFPFRNSNRLEDGFKYYTNKINEYKIQNDSLCLTQCYYVLSGFNRISGQIDFAIYNMKKSISYIDSSKNLRNWASNTSSLGMHYLSKEKADDCIKYNRIAKDLFIKIGVPYSYISMRIAQAMLMKHQLDSAAYFIALAKTEPIIISPDNKAIFFQTEVQLKIQLEAFDEAEKLLEEYKQLIKKNNISVNSYAGTLAPDYYFAQLRIKQNRLQEAIDLLHLDISRLLNNRIEILRDYRLISELYTKIGNATKASEFYGIFLSKQDSLLADQEKYRSISFEAEQQMNEQERSIANLENQNRIASLYRNFLIGFAVLLLLVVGGIYQRFLFKKKANQLLQNQKEEIELQKKNVEKTLSELKATQSQLIQSEKMASLGELTAGIAHEIQNPLNFVNNFSEVNTELIDELEHEADLGNLTEVKSLAKDIKDNEQKINYHGKRAADIVKGMLQHSRSSSGVKEPTDINALCDEYLRLSYHGLRAKDKSFNAMMKTDFDESIDKVNIIPQDIGRVVLNLINNAFYVVGEKSSIYSAAADQSENQKDVYEPTVSISTKKLDGKILITVSDNGNGIPTKVLDKIFQPFFTTKPTGQGTGLGLSLSYDIVKAHGGQLTVKTQEGEGSAFTITL